MARTLAHPMFIKPHHRMYAAVFLLDCALMMGFTAVPFLVMRQYRGSVELVGGVLGFQSLFYALATLVASRLVVKAQNGLRAALVGMACYGLLFSLAPALPNAYLYCMASMIAFGCMALVWPSLWSWIGGEPDLDVRVRRISHYNISWCCGLSLGPLLAGPLYSVDYRLPFVCVFFLVSIAWFLVSGIPHEKDHYGSVDGDKEQDRDAFHKASESHLYYAWFANFLGLIFIGAARSVFADRVESLAAADRFVQNGIGAFELTDAVIVFSILMFIINFSRVLVFFLMGWTRCWEHRPTWLFACQIAAGIALYVLGSTNSVAVMVLCCFIIGTNGGVGFVTAVSYALANPARKHSRAAINECMVGSGMFVGAMGLALIAGRLGVPATFKFGPLIVVLGIAAELGLFRLGRRMNRDSKPGPVDV